MIDNIPKINNTTMERQRGMAIRSESIDQRLTSFVASDVCDLSIQEPREAKTKRVTVR